VNPAARIASLAPSQNERNKFAPTTLPETPPLEYIQAAGEVPQLSARSDAGGVLRGVARWREPSEEGFGGGLMVDGAVAVDG